MAKPLEIPVVFGDAPNSALAVKVWMEGKGDLYVTNTSELLAGKHSYHQSGVTHQYLNLFGERHGVGAPPRVKLKDLKGFRSVTSFMANKPPPITGYSPKTETKTRKVLRLPMPKWGWYLNVWAIEKDREDIVERILQTEAWSTVPRVGSLLADWHNPWVLVTIGFWATTTPYKIYRYSPRIPGRPPYKVVPSAYEGTWLKAALEEFGD
jgi:hypothetical protein